MELVKTGSTWVAHTEFSERSIPSAAGFKWNPDARKRATKDASFANLLREYADADTQVILDADLLDHLAIATFDGGDNFVCFSGPMEA